MRTVAFYLPQYHPIPENDEWWGPGFTEWSNVARARPLYRGHRQPDLPTELGFYDLRVPEVREQQADLARAHGIDAFCYYHYWFGGRRVLERPFDDVLRSGRPELPFCLCWANENWTRSWNARGTEILLAQRYSEEDDHAHGRWLAGAMRDGRYLRIDGRALLLIYRASELPNPRRTAEIFREEIRREGGGEVLLCRVEGHFAEQGDPASVGCDAAVEFQPDWRALARQRSGPAGRGWRRARLELGRDRPTTYSYNRLAADMLAKASAPYVRFPCVVPGWDNSPRSGNRSLVLEGSTPENFEQWVGAVLDRESRVPGGNRLMFINAWNEWGEGNHLEPSERWGRGYLEAFRAALRSRSMDGNGGPAVSE